MAWGEPDAEEILTPNPETRKPKTETRTPESEIETRNSGDEGDASVEESPSKSDPFLSLLPGANPKPLLLGENPTRRGNPIEQNKCHRKCVFPVFKSNNWLMNLFA